MTRRDFGPAPSRVADTPTYDGPVTQLIETNSGDLLLFYHRSDIGHTAPDGRVALRRSTDRGKTWTEPRIIHDEPDRDVLDPSVVYDPDSGRIHLFDVAVGFSEPVESPSDLHSLPSRENFDTFLVESTDYGDTWQEPRPIADRLDGERVIPFGGSARTSEGVITCFYSRDWTLQALISSDAGQTWNRHVSITESPDGRQLCEPVPCAITESKLLVFGRDNATGDFFALKSADGGLTWRAPVFFNPMDSEAPAPIWCKKTGPNRLTAVWGDRDDLCVYAVNMSAHLVWQDPTELARESRKRLHKATVSPEDASYWDGGAGDFGYSTFAQLGKHPSDILVTCYDGAPWPDVWMMALY